jgi:biotin-(acetyl-CoA carboxylase) ligase
MGQEVSRLAILRQVLVEMERLYQSLPQGELLLEQWKTRLITLGQNVHVNLGDKIYRGIAESVCRDGSLMVRQKDGSLTKIIAGDVNIS